MSQLPRWRKWLRGVLIAVVAFELLYVGAANAILSTRILRDAASKKPEEVALDYDNAWTGWPGLVQVRDFTLRFQDRNVEFLLRIDSATIHVALLDLARLKFHATKVRATGVSWRQGMKTDDAAGQEERLAAYPEIEGFARPPIRPPPPPGEPPPPGDGDWTVEIEDVDVAVREVWVVEYRYLGEGRATGAFEVQPNHHVWVGPANLKMTGTLTAGSHPVSSDFKMAADFRLARTEISELKGLKVFRPMSTSVQIDSPLENLGVAQLYLPDLKIGGTGTLHLDLRVTEGKLTPKTEVELKLSNATVQQPGANFKGTANVRFGVTDDTQTPNASAALSGVLTASLEGKPITAALTGVNGTLALVTNDLVEGLDLSQARARVKEARVEDASAVKSAASARMPIILPQILGDGPLVASAAAFMNPAQTLIRLHDARLGGASVHGAAAKDSKAQSWNGALAAKAATLNIGLRIKSGNIEVAPLIGDGWLETELKKAGIDPRLAQERDEERHTGADCPSCQRGADAGVATITPEKRP